jgi:hypothetical protein
MITPCNKPLKNNPFTTYRDPVTGRWTVVVETVLTGETDSTPNGKAESKNESKIAKIPTASSSICLTKQNIFLYLSLVKYRRKKSAVNLTLIPNLHH